MIQVYKASAGAGKTTRLTKEYLDLLKNDDSYRHVLAVTFTNKATADMKERILEVFSERAENDPTTRRRLERLLHDYSNFSVTTIDKFFQQVIRAFARELGQYNGFNVELDEAGVLSKTVDNMMDSLENPDSGQLLEWLKTYAFNKLQQGSKVMGIEGDLISIAKLFLKEEFRLKNSETPILQDKEAILSLGKRMDEEMEKFRSESKGLAQKALELMSLHGLTQDDFKGKSRSIFASRLNKLAEGEVSPPTLTHCVVADDFELWPADKKSSGVVREAYDAGMGKAIYDLVGLYADENDRTKPARRYLEYMTAKNIRGNLYLIGIFKDLYDNFQTYLKENGLMLLSESTAMLNKLIGKNDTPFIYEKVGNRYDHIMLDEFQDTSRIQWANFKPLYENSVSQIDYSNGGETNANLIVGDVKQSIYRFRGSDWKLLDEQINKDFLPGQLKSDDIEENWRSGEKIVGFNNDFFSQAGSIINNDKVAGIYRTCHQKAQFQGGHVYVEFIGKQDEKKKSDDNNKDDAQFKEIAIEKSIEAIRDMLNRNYPYSSITVLTRKNDEADIVAAALAKAGIPVMTEQSLTIDSSRRVGRLLAVLKYFSDSDDRMNAMLMDELGIDANEINLKDGSIYELCEVILRHWSKDISAGEVPYVTAFLDEVMNYTAKNGSDLEGFLCWWDENRGSKAISQPEGQDAVRIMTIHKSKGLSMDAVIVPFFKESVNPSGKDYIWCKAPEPFDEAGLIPVKAKKELLNTLFAEEYKTECDMTAMDAVNTAYVAFTRPRMELYIFAQNPGEAKEFPANLSEALYSRYCNQLENSVYEIGEKAEYAKLKKIGEEENAKPKEEKKLKAKPVEVKEELFRSYDIDQRLEKVCRGGDFFDGDDFSKAGKRIRGIVIHDILSRIRTAADIDHSIEEALLSGELPASSKDEVKETVTSLVESVASYGWFSPEAKVYNETAILSPDGTETRPDRLAQLGDMMTVIDYKTGAPHKSHHLQVGGYMEKLRQMGYPQVRGYIWYLSSGAIEPVSDLI